MAAIDPSIYEYINVTSTDGRNTVNIAGGVVSLSFFENLFSPHISATFLVVNTGGVVAVSYTHLTLTTILLV